MQHEYPLHKSHPWMKVLWSKWRLIVPSHLSQNFFLKFIPLLLHIHDIMMILYLFLWYIVNLYWTSSAMCEPGSYSPSGLNDPQAPCRTCEKGYYQSKSGQTQCIPCYSKYTTSRRGSPTASECKGMFWTVTVLPLKPETH